MQTTLTHTTPNQFTGEILPPEKGHIRNFFVGAAAIKKKDDTDVSTTEPADYDDGGPDTTEDTESTGSSTDTLYRRSVEKRNVF